MESFSLFQCANGCPGMVEGLWAAIVTVALGALVTLLLAVNAADKEARTGAIVILVAGGLSTLIAARFVAVAVWRILDPAIG